MVSPGRPLVSRITIVGHHAYIMAKLKIVSLVSYTCGCMFLWMDNSVAIYYKCPGNRTVTLAVHR